MTVVVVSALSGTLRRLTTVDAFRSLFGTVCYTSHLKWQILYLCKCSTFLNLHLSQKKIKDRFFKQNVSMCSTQILSIQHNSCLDTVQPEQILSARSRKVIVLAMSRQHTMLYDNLLVVLNSELRLLLCYSGHCELVFKIFFHDLATVTRMPILEILLLQMPIVMSSMTSPVYSPTWQTVFSEICACTLHILALVL